MDTDIKSDVSNGLSDASRDFPFIDLQKSNRCNIIKMSGRCETRLRRSDNDNSKSAVASTEIGVDDNNLDYFKIWPSQANGNADEPQICVDIRLNSLVRTNSIVIISSISVGIFTTLNIPGQL